MFSLLLCLIVSFQIAESQEPKTGGTLRYAMIGTPPSLDQHVITSDLATMIAQHWSEGLYTFDASYAPVPMLA
jgi:peptide/nickel transport system substrate-binding protein